MATMSLSQISDLIPEIYSIMTEPERRSELADGARLIAAIGAEIDRRVPGAESLTDAGLGSNVIPFRPRTK